jgi:hypothetical protein
MSKTVPIVPTSGGGGMPMPAYLLALLLAGVLATCALVGAWSEPAKAAFPSSASGRQAAAKRAGGRASRATSAGGWSCSPRATRRGSASPRRAS